MQILKAEADKKAAELVQKQQNSSRRRKSPKSVPADSSAVSRRKKD
jgi:hypothetical protein